MRSEKTVAVIGAGAAGLAAAIEIMRTPGAVGNGVKVILIEKLDRVGKKILSTGNGRCNLSNINASADGYFGGRTLVDAAFKRFSPEETLRFFRSIGLLCSADECGRVYPASNTASSVLDTLRHECERLGVKTVCSSRVESITEENGMFSVIIGTERVRARCVILSCGGKSSPKLGSAGDGYKIVEQMGHRVTPLMPSLVQLICTSPYLRSVKGLRFTGDAQLVANGKPVHTERGEILFADYGLSGIAAMQLSSHYARLSGGDRRSARVVLDFLPEYSYDGLGELLAERLYKMGYDSFGTFMTGMFHRRIFEMILKSCGLTQQNFTGAVRSREVMDRIKRAVKHFELPIEGVRGFDSSQVTSGGAAADEFDPETLESKLCNGLYVAGELLDVDGPCGGYNLQWAWSSGRLAGRSAAERILERRE